VDKIQELLTRGVEKIYPSKEELEKVLRSGKKIKLYQGFDPTGTDLHIGHMVGLKKLKQWQDLGHHVIFLIGDGTGQAGDPSGKTRTRDKFLTQKELRNNAVDYVKQAGKIVRFKGDNPVEILFNGDWLNKLTLPAILKLFDHFSKQQLSERDLFQERDKRGEEVKMREFIYPTLQAYDSVAMDVDLELGATDQTFNMLAGRTLLKTMKGKNKFVITTPLLTDSNGQKIGKTEGNVIALNDKPEDLFAKIMALPDDFILKGFEYLTDISMSDINETKSKLEKGENPVSYKKKLAFEIVKQLNDKIAAQKSLDAFGNVVQRQQLPEEISTYRHAGNIQENIIDLLMQTKLAKSKSEAKRLLDQGGVTVNESRITNHETLIKVKNDMIIRVGKRKFLRIKLNASR
jgi:tyrosyl-tRNA synthetase